MRAICIYRENQDYSRSVNDWLEAFYRQTGHTLEIMDPDRETGFCEAYDIVEYPTFIVIGETGEVCAMWRGVDQLPLFNEVMYYLI